MIFLAEPTGLSPRNSTEPDGKTASPAKKQCCLKGYLSRVRVGRGNGIKITFKCQKTVSTTNRWTNEWTDKQTDRETDGQTAPHGKL